MSTLNTTIKRHHVSRLPRVRSVDSDLVDLLGIFTEILDMAQDVTVSILADEVSKICSKTHVTDCRAMVAPFLCGKALEENEALAVEKVLTESDKTRTESWEREVGLPRLSAGGRSESASWSSP